MPVGLSGFASLYASATIFALTSIFVKFASRGFSGFFISSTRFVIGVLLCLFVLFRSYGGVRIKNPKAVLFRGIFGASSMALTYAAISMTGPGRASLLSNIYPLFVPVFGALFFGERFHKKTLVSLVLCTLGAILVVRDGSGASMTGDLLAIGSSVFAAVAVNFVRLASRTENPFVIYLSPCVFGLPLFFFAPLPQTPPAPLSICFLIAVGIGAFTAQALMAHGYKSVPAGRGSLVFYWETALTVILGALVAGEHFNLRFALGLGFIVTGLWFNNRKDGRAVAQAA